MEVRGAASIGCSRRSVFKYPIPYVLRLLAMRLQVVRMKRASKADCFKPTEVVTEKLDSSFQAYINSVGFYNMDCLLLIM